MASEDLGEDWERTEFLYKKFEEFQQELTARKEKVDGVNKYADACEVSCKSQCRERVLTFQKNFWLLVGGT